MGEEPNLHKRAAKEEGQARLSEAGSGGHMDHEESPREQWSMNVEDRYLTWCPGWVFRRKRVSEEKRLVMGDMWRWEPSVT